MTALIPPGGQCGKIEGNENVSALDMYTHVLTKHLVKRCCSDQTVDEKAVVCHIS